MRVPPNSKLYDALGFSEVCNPKALTHAHKLKDEALIERTQNMNSMASHNAIVP